MSNGGKRRAPPGAGKSVASPPYEIYEEKRKYPRVAVDRPMEMLSGGQELQGVIHDISPDGLQIRCDRKTMQAIRPSGKAIKGGTGPLVNVVFRLPIGRREKTIKAEVRLYYFVLLPDEKTFDVAIGARFTSQAGECQADVEAFFRDALQPIEDAIVALLDEPRTIAEIADHVGVSPQRAEETVARMKSSYQLMELQSNNQVRYLQLGAALALLLKKVADLERRLREFETGAGRG